MPKNSKKDPLRSRMLFPIQKIKIPKGDPFGKLNFVRIKVAQFRKQYSYYFSIKNVCSNEELVDPFNQFETRRIFVKFLCSFQH